MVLENQQKHEVIVLSQKDHLAPLVTKNEWMLELKNIKKLPGPRFPDGSINWQCPCMAAGSLVAHRCGHHFRQLYICMSENDHDDVTVKCPDQFINWSACMQNVNEKRKMEMKEAMKNDNKELFMADKNVIYYVDKDFHATQLLKEFEDFKKITPVESSFHEDGRINIECPCLQSPLAHRCGHLLRAAVQCTNSSKTSPRGTDCVEHFMEFDLCLKSYEN